MTVRSWLLLILAVGGNALLVAHLSSIPALAAFAATLGGTLSGALGFQVLARLQAWAKRWGSRDAPIPDNPGHGMLRKVWARSQMMHCDLTRDGRNIRKDAWLQLHGRFALALHLPDPDASEAIVDALEDHLETFPEVDLDPRLCRELRRFITLRWEPHAFDPDTDSNDIKHLIKKIMGS